MQWADEVHTDLDYADDVALLAEMFSVLVLAVGVMHEEARLFGLEINWSKTKIQTSADKPDIHQVLVAGSTVDEIDSFTYLGCNVDRHGSSGAETTI